MSVALRSSLVIDSFESTPVKVNFMLFKKAISVGICAAYSYNDHKHTTKVIHSFSQDKSNRTPKTCVGLMMPTLCQVASFAEKLSNHYLEYGFVYVNETGALFSKKL
jgi:hypothetical protein